MTRDNSACEPCGQHPAASARYSSCETRVGLDCLADVCEYLRKGKLLIGICFTK